MTAAHAMLGLVLGVVGGGAHLALTWWRARLITSGRTGLAWTIYPLGLAAVGLTLYGAARVAPIAAWLFVVGLLGSRFVTLHLVRSRS